VRLYYVQAQKVLTAVPCSQSQSLLILHKTCTKRRATHAIRSNGYRIRSATTARQNLYSAVRSRPAPPTFSNASNQCNDLDEHYHSLSIRTGSEDHVQSRSIYANFAPHLAELVTSACGRPRSDPNWSSCDDLWRISRRRGAVLEEGLNIRGNCLGRRIRILPSQTASPSIRLTSHSRPSIVGTPLRISGCCHLMAVRHAPHVIRFRLYLFHSIGRRRAHCSTRARSRRRTSY